MPSSAALHDLNVSYAVANPDIAFESFDGEVVVVDLRNGKYYSFSDSGSILWEGLAAGTVPADLISNTPFGMEIPTFLARLCEAGLLAVAPGAARSPLDAALTARLSAAVEAPDVTVFDDMADLFVADPIHDVEEPEGWPVVKRA